GIGIPHVYNAFDWYRKYLGMDIRVFDEAAEAALMLPYTGGKPQQRHAILAINIQGGGGLEIWQYTSRVPQPPAFQIRLGDHGIFISKYKSRNVREAFRTFKNHGLNVIGELSKNPAGKDHFYLKDPYGNLIEIVGSEDWFKNYSSPTGGVYGCVIGVSDIEKSRKVYSEILGYDEVLSDETGAFEDFQDLPGGSGKFRRVILKNSRKRVGAFGRLLGDAEIELVQALDRDVRKIYENRF